jgi:polar amino acid transport system permease protein
MLDWLSPESGALLLRGLALTIGLTGVTSLLALALGIGIGLLKILNRPIIPKIASAYIEIHRNIPALVLIIFWTFAFPNIFPLELRSKVFYNNPVINATSTFTGLSVPYYVLAAGFGLTLNTSAYLAELFRAGVGTIPSDLLEAARTLGAPKAALLRRIIIPQGIRGAFPAIATRLIHNMKNTALAAFVATPEFFHSIQTAITHSFRAVELLLLAAVVYLLLAFGFSAILRWVENRLNISYLKI